MKDQLVEIDDSYAADLGSSIVKVQRESLKALHGGSLNGGLAI